MKEVVTYFLYSHPAEFFEKTIKDLMKRWEKCVELNGGYVVVLFILFFMNTVLYLCATLYCDDFARMVAIRIQL